MCKTAFFKSPRCGCRWWRIAEPCGPGMGFSTCGRFFDGRCKPAPPSYRAWSEPCPTHDLLGVYDRNQVRMVLGLHNGFRFGTGPSLRDPGVEVRCVVM